MEETHLSLEWPGMVGSRYDWALSVSRIVIRHLHIYQ